MTATRGATNASRAASRNADFPLTLPRDDRAGRSIALQRGVVRKSATIDGGGIHPARRRRDDRYDGHGTTVRTPVRRSPYHAPGLGDGGPDAPTRHADARAARDCSRCWVARALPAAAAQNDYPAKDSGYHNYPEMVQTLMDAQAAYPDIVRVFSIGDSYQGRAILAAEVSDHVGTDEGEPEVMFDGAASRPRAPVGRDAPVHPPAADQHSTAGPAPLASGSPTSWTADASGSSRWSTPTACEYDLGGDPYRSWRKNRQPNPGSSAVGTDLNRNYDYAWSRAPSRARAPSTTAAPAPFSAPETRAMRDFVLSRRVGRRPAHPDPHLVPHRGRVRALALRLHAPRTCRRT